MEKIVVTGGRKLEGRIKVSGAKNAVLPIIAASLLAEGECELHEVPRLADVETITSLLASLGVKVTRNDGDFTFDARTITSVEAPEKYVRKMRASILVMGPLLARLGEAKISMPGGCNIGSRPIDLHLKGLAALGAEFNVGHGTIEARTTRLKGNRVYLDFPSVGATENIMMAATLAEGTTIIENAAEEPEIVDLANFLNSIGAKVAGAGTNIIKIEGVEKLHGTPHVVIPDRIEAGTYMAMAAATGGDVLVDNVITDHLKPIIAKLQEAGAEIIEEEDGVWVKGIKPLKAVDIKTLPYPGFPTDMQAQMMALMTTAKGTSVVTETVFENRFMHVNEFRRMGANIVIEGHSAVVKGIENLTGAAVKASDLRAGAALILSGLMAEGETFISAVHHIDRGYENIVEKLKGIGADVRRMVCSEDLLECDDNGK
ncbi:MAG: UDP-N-acetylglucosamine 1-carboxyvinyltransferase [Clostridia bacterium]|nr:UDP-N-acetylglucosamine 1-carboxyvinyltransferase [Clostridiales bacterium]MDK2985075.1 UDP-N-acetylglucosamine 1-carboxyvinyltransferase [Clostridia bacterium]